MKSAKILTVSEVSSFARTRQRRHSIFLVIKRAAEKRREKILEELEETE